MTAFDELPQAMREALARSAYGLDARNMHRAIQDGMTTLRRMGAHPTADQCAGLLAQALPTHEDSILKRASDAYEQKYGTPLPHVAAQATFQR